MLAAQHNFHVFVSDGPEQKGEVDWRGVDEDAAFDGVLLQEKDQLREVVVRGSRALSL